MNASNEVIYDYLAKKKKRIMIGELCHLDKISEITRREVAQALQQMQLQGLLTRNLFEGKAFYMLSSDMKDTQGHPLTYAKAQLQLETLAKKTECRQKLQAATAAFEVEEQKYNAMKELQKQAADKVEFSQKQQEHKNDNINKQMSDLEAEKQAKYDELQEELNQVNEQIEQHKAMVSEKQKEKEIIQTALDGISFLDFAKRNAFEKQIAESEASIQLIKEHMYEYVQKKTSIDKERKSLIARYDNNIFKLNKSINGLDQHIDEEKETLARIDEKLLECEKAYKESKEILENLKKEASSYAK